MSSPAAHNYADPALPPRICQNCGATLRGPYCAKCGQHDVDYHRSFHHLTHDLLENLFHFDGKFLVSVAWLLAKPGRMTVEFNAGRRTSQVPPLRFYIFVTVLFFLGVNLLNHGHIFPIDRRATDAVSRQIKDGVKTFAAPPEFTTRQKVRYGELFGEAMGRSTKIDAKQRAEIVAQVLREMPAPAPGAPTPTTTTAAAPKTSKGIVKQKPNTRGQFVFSTDEDEEGKSALSRAFKEKLESGELTFTAFLDHLESRVPTLLFLGMPVFALLLKLLFFRSGRYYIEHLICSVHLHTWAFLVFMVASGYFRLIRLGPPPLINIFAQALGVWMIGYVLLAFRTVYQESWLATVLKTGLLGALYLFALCLLAGALVVLTVVMIVYG